MEEYDKLGKSSTFVQKVTPQGRVTVPKPVREVLMINTGDKLEVTIIQLTSTKDRRLKPCPE